MPDAEPLFVTTHWSMVIRAGGEDTTAAHGALSELCRIYWFPLYAFIRRSGKGPQDAEDLTQAFFAKLLEKNFIADADADRGKFRTFLLVALKRFLANEWDRANALKRGGGIALLPIDSDMAETRFGTEPAHHERPDILFERQWAVSLLDQVLKRLETDYAETERAELFTHLRACLTRDDSALPYAEIGARMQMTEAAVKMAVQRLRARYKALLLEEIGKTVTSPDEVGEELRYLFSVFAVS